MTLEFRVCSDLKLVLARNAACDSNRDWLEPRFQCAVTGHATGGPGCGFQLTITARGRREIHVHQACRLSRRLPRNFRLESRNVAAALPALILPTHILQCLQFEAVGANVLARHASSQALDTASDAQTILLIQTHIQASGIELLPGYTPLELRNQSIQTNPLIRTEIDANITLEPSGLNGFLGVTNFQITAVIGLQLVLRKLELGDIQIPDTSGRRDCRIFESTIEGHFGSQQLEVLGLPDWKFWEVAAQRKIKRIRQTSHPSRQPLK